MMTAELKPVRCGCGGEAKVETDHDTIQPVSSVDWKRVVCTKCNIRTAWRKTEAEAITAWNRAMGERMELQTVERTAKVETYTDDQQETWSVCECGTDVWKIYNYCPECGAKLDWSGNE